MVPEFGLQVVDAFLVVLLLGIELGAQLTEFLGVSRYFVSRFSEDFDDVGIVRRGLGFGVPIFFEIPVFLEASVFFETYRGVFINLERRCRVVDFAGYVRELGLEGEIVERELVALFL